MDAKPFQYSMARMFLAIALVCIAVWLFVRADRYYHDIVLEEGSGEGLVELMRMGAFTAIAASVGVIFRKTRICLWVAVIAMFVRCLFLPQVY